MPPFPTVQHRPPPSNAIHHCPAPSSATERLRRRVNPSPHQRSSAHGPPRTALSPKTVIS
ncbi:hypothetical protein AOQ84DRAFT_354028 [Glonium stellatum]|uniref:Uncharacterized protein n=1 Tax=Glonium stellatum TaxID=574774 RepID=A0A8E2F2T3_9PEZI|nr:hypothetical protein AOQ84DRAFT_354028 [Glonium stellatum]